jgi:hypothetical protein
VLDPFVDLGFWYIKPTGSGQAIKEKYAKARIPGDLFVWHPNHGGFQIEVGGANKRVTSEIAEMRARLLVGFTPLVVLFRKGKRAYFLSRTSSFATVPELLAELEK